MQPTILVVEDNEIARKLLKVALANAGYIVLAAENGEQALRYMQTTSPDLILQDLVLPDMDGVELNRRLRELPNGHDIPIIALSGFLNKIEELQAGYWGFTTYLIKPIEPSRLVEVIKKYLPLTLSDAEKVGTGQRILVVDDDPVQLKLLSLHLKHAGFNVVVAIDGDDALQQIRENPPAAILSDIFMPCLDGFELCLKVRQEPDLAHIPVILISTQYFEEKDKELAQKIGANDFVLRTEDFKEIIPALLKSLKSKPPVLTTFPDHVFKDEHIHSLIRQLEHQVSMSTELKQRSALQTAQLSLLKGVVNMMTTKLTSINSILENVIISTLDATGISNGALYLKNENNKLFLQQFIGYEENDREALSNFFGQSDLLTQAMITQQTMVLPSSAILPQKTTPLLKNAKIKVGLLIPLVSTNEYFGVLFLGSNVANVINQDFVLFAQALGKQIGQTIALINAFKQLAISEQQHRTLMDKASCGIIICNHEGVILEINNEVERLFSLPKEQILGKSYRTFVVSNDQDYSYVLFQKLLIEKSIGPIIGRIQQANGMICDVEYTVDCIEIDSNTLLFAVINDITESKRLRAQALLSDKLATVGKLAAGIVHEINNPVTWLLNNLIFIKENLSTVRKNKDFQQLAQIEEMIADSIQGSKQIRDIVRNLKGYARIDEETANNIDIHEVLNAAIKIALPTFKHKINIETDFATNIPKSLLVRSKLQQVFLNLIVNAAQSMSGEESEKNIIRIKTALEDSRIRIEVSDTGQGIPPENLQRIFEPFFTTKPQETGSGLGLSICKDIIQSLGGEIDVRTTLGVGSTFTVVLPLEVIADSVKEIEVNINKNLSARILAIDDEPTLLKTLQRILEPMHKVTPALGGREALNILTQNPYSFDIIISDLNMPDVTGLDIYRFLINKQPGLERHIIFITGGADLALQQKFLADISNPCLEKPFTKEDLLRIVNQIMAARAGISHKA